jgi:hypothetical protein
MPDTAATLSIGARSRRGSRHRPGRGESVAGPQANARKFLFDRRGLEGNFIRMFPLAVQFTSGVHAKQANLLAPVLTIVVTAALGGMLLALLERTVPPIRRSLHARAARRRQIRAAATAELRARAMMDELCPYGWRAQIVVFSSAEDLPTDAPDRASSRVQLDWAELREPAIVRRIWAQNLHQALEAMVADRITDETLQQIEHQALADGATWPDP